MPGHVYSEDPIANAILHRAHYLHRKVLGGKCHGPSRHVAHVEEREAELVKLEAALHEGDRFEDLQPQVLSLANDVTKWRNHLVEEKDLVESHRASVSALDVADDVYPDDTVDSEGLGE